MKASNQSKSRNWRALYTAIRAMDGSGLSRKRKSLEKMAKKILRKRESLARKMLRVKAQENSYRVQRREYDSVVATVANKLRYQESKSFQDRQKELDDVYREWENAPQQNGMEF